VRDIDQVITALRRRHPALLIEQRGADDEGIWVVKHPSTSIEVKLESSAGNCPFLIESSLSPERLHAASMGEAINMVSTMLGSDDGAT
jgi:hypothetical protein